MPAQKQKKKGKPNKTSTLHRRPIFVRPFYAAVMPSDRRSSSPSSSSRSPNYPSSSSTTTSHHSPPMSDEDEAVPSATSPARPPASPPPKPSDELLALSAPPSTARSHSFPMREDCWSEDATHTLIQAWGSHYLELNRGSLRQQHWQQVSEAVNSLHAHTKKLHRSDIQCKNRIDTLKKKFKVEKFKSLQSNGRYVSSWPFFDSLDSLIGDNFAKPKRLSPSPPMTRRSFVKKDVSPAPVPVKREFPSLPPPPSTVPVGPRSKRPAPVEFVEEPVLKRNSSAMTAAAAAAAAARVGIHDDDEEDSEMSSPERRTRAGARTGGIGKAKKMMVSGHVLEEGYRKLAEAIGSFAEIYERVEEAKHRQLVELEKQKMQFAKDLELQRMKLFMESQVQLEKLKRSRRNSQSGGYFR
ncbi:OLC1v1023744C1 [Oldenlandia corymbosa var. corymbosa]|uniref:OLC1v1023744C1 n=1 Tax=Oldenlandia corymbosa var. corymbosa TaxID=529605 RepID=A0AAV1C1E2_OLDCO|nr:OLC1v1023744C1 [Oldenlandia corymbosa var. corymbosa]